MAAIAGRSRSHEASNFALNPYACHLTSTNSIRFFLQKSRSLRGSNLYRRLIRVILEPRGLPPGDPEVLPSLIRAPVSLEPRGFEPLTSSMPLRRSTN